MDASGTRDVAGDGADVGVDGVGHSDQLARRAVRTDQPWVLQGESSGLAVVGTGEGSSHLELAV